MPIIVRQFREKDQSKVLELYRTGLLSYTNANSVPEVPPICARFVEGRCAPGGDMHDIVQNYLTGDKRNNFFVAEEEETGKILGCVGAIPSTEFDPNEYMELVRMSVDPTSRGSGVGVKLLETFENWARSQGYKHVNLTTLDGMQAAVRFYSKNGYNMLKDKEQRLDLSKYGIVAGEGSHAVSVVHYVKQL
jgi:N-acetylglutamate synthase-like GNAT family acetyltransferase